VQPNGVDLAAYRRDSPAPARLPAEPFAVYVGSVQSRVDLELLATVAKEVPVVVAGPADEASAEVLRSTPLTWLGPIDVALVPGLLQRAAVGLLPHRVDAFTASMDPMKLLEYLAAGLPVVSTPLPGTGLSTQVRVAGDADAFCSAVREAIGQRRGGVDPAVVDRDWSVVAGDLLDLYVGASP
jgi:glycosyltransferase involved in cell wall biosynthesis